LLDCWQILHQGLLGLIVSLLGLIGVARGVARQLLMITMQDFQLSGAHRA